MSMQIDVQTLAGFRFHVEYNDDDSVRHIKEKIAARDDLPEKYTADLLKFLYVGSVLDDEKTMGSYSLKSDGYLVLVKQTPGKYRPPKKDPPLSFQNAFGANRAPNSMGQFSDPFMSSSFQQDPFMASSFQKDPFLSSSFQKDPFMASSFPQGPFAQAHVPAHQKPFPSHTSLGGMGTTYTPPPAVPAPTAVDNAADDHLQALISLGFSREKAETALRAASYDFHAALDDLTSDTTLNVDDEPPLHKKIEGRRASPMSLIQSNPPNPTIGQHAGGGAIASSAQGQKLSQTLRNDPQQLQAIKQQLRSEHPEIANMIDSNPEQFFNIMDQVAAQSATDASSRPTETINVHLSPREQEAITRLESMGFERNKVIEAYLCCDRNEELAVNFLLNSFN